MRTMVTIYFDKEYYRWAPLLIRSLAVNSPKIGIHVHGVNLTRVQLRELKAFKNVKKVSAYEIPHDPEISYEFAFQMIERKAYFFRKTFDLFSEADLYILMDVDTLVVNPLNKLEKIMESYDMAGVMTNPEKIMGGFLAVKNKAVTKAYWKELDDFLMDGGGFYYNKDQPAIFRLYKKYADRIKFLGLGFEYLNIWSKNERNIFVWSAHKLEYGDKDFRYKLYKEKLEEMEGKK